MPRTLTSLAAAAALPLLAQAQPDAAWQACTALPDTQRLACFDDWAKRQRPGPAEPPGAVPTPAPAATVAQEPPPAPVARRGVRLTPSDDCRDPRHSELTRFWELEAGADCGTFGIRGYRPISLAIAVGDDVNQQPTSGNPANNATTSTPYRRYETRLQLSVRTKVAQGLFAYQGSGTDSLWFAYSQQSYWQVFTPELSRPFRNTDHEPEVMYVAPIQSAVPGSWRLRLGGLGLVHQSNGQQLPLSRSWNRVYLAAGAERDDVQVYGRLWHRISEKGHDDNPGISDYIGRGELLVRWQPSREHLFQFTGRHGLKKDTHGSVRLEWFRTLADTGIGLPSGLRLHTSLFSGYGDSLLDYNKPRTVLSLGLALVEW